MQGIKLVTFDVTNTLLKFRLPPWEYYTLIARKQGFKGNAEDIKHQLKYSMKYMFEKYPNFGSGSILWKNWWREVVKLTFKDKISANSNIEVIADELIYVFGSSKCWNIADGALEVLKLLHNQGKLIGVISNFDPRLHNILHDVQLYDKFSFVLTSYEVGSSKPEKKIFDEALQKCKTILKPCESLHIGDDLHKDYEGARAAGWHALLIGTRKYETPPKSSHVFSNLEKLCLDLQENIVKL